MFITDATDEDKAGYLSHSAALIFPGVDDFGITAVEALAAGIPVIAYNGGGALDYMIDKKTGLLFNRLSVDCLATCLESFTPKNFDSRLLKEVAAKFSTSQFNTKFKTYIDSIL
jgi:glycosyltransferase involved in cell wall biosynthesis